MVLETRTIVALTDQVLPTGHQRLARFLTKIQSAFNLHNHCLPEKNLRPIETCRKKTHTNVRVYVGRRSWILDLGNFRQAFHLHGRLAGPSSSGTRSVPNGRSGVWPSHYDNRRTNLQKQPPSPPCEASVFEKAEALSKQNSTKRKTVSSHFHV